MRAGSGTPPGRGYAHGDSSGPGVDIPSYGGVPGVDLPAGLPNARKSCHNRLDNLSEEESVADLADPFPAVLRARRRERGLSQTELAGDVLSPSYVSLLEAGKRAPTPKVVEYLADRLGCSSAFLLTGMEGRPAAELVLELRYAELALHSGEAAEAERRFRRLLAEPLLSGSPEVEGQARLGLARALEAQGHLELAIAAYEQLLEDDALGDGRLVVDTALCRCYREVGDLSHAIAVAERALERARGLGLRGTDEEVELAATLVAAYHERGDLTRARVLAAQVLERAEQAGSRRARGAAYWNASLVAEAQGLPVEALRLADRAMALYAEGDAARAIGRLRSAYAWLLLRQPVPDPVQALEVLDAAAAALEETGSQVDLAYCDVEASRAHLELGRPQDALAAAQRALVRLGPAPRLEAASGLVVLGRAALALGDRDEGTSALRRAAQVLDAAGSSREAAAVWCELAELLAAAGDSEQALDAYRRAAGFVGLPTGARLPAALPVAAGPATG